MVKWWELESSMEEPRHHEASTPVKIVYMHALS
jgi:hypothetical protein